MGKEQVVGTWKLVGTEFRDEKGEIYYPYGRELVGQLIYEDNGYMSVHFVSTTRPRFKSHDHHGGTPEEIKNAYDGYIGYFGTYELDEAKGTIIHYVRGSLFPDMMGGKMPRFYKISGNRLTLTTPPTITAGVKLVGVLVWEKIGL